MWPMVKKSLALVHDSDLKMILRTRSRSSDGDVIGAEAVRSEEAEEDATPAAEAVDVGSSHRDVVPGGQPSLQPGRSRRRRNRLHQNSGTSRLAGQ